MDAKDKLIKSIFFIISIPIEWLARLLVLVNAFELKNDYNKIYLFKQSINECPTLLINALVAAEDHRFYLHRGFDPVSIIRAVWNLVIKKNLQGGSTIEQQLVRVLTDNYQLTIIRKIREIFLASIVGCIFPKNYVATIYLSVAYFGWHMDGISEACSRLNITISEITPIQASSIIARLKYPEPKRIADSIKRKIVRRTLHIHNNIEKNLYNNGIHKHPATLL